MILAALLLAPILLLWMAASRTSRLRHLGGLVLTGLIGLDVALAALLPRAVLEIALGGLLLVLAVVGAGLAVERRRLGRPRERRVTVATGLLAGWVLIVVCCGAVIWRPAAFFPDTDGVLPLPPGLGAAVGPRDANSCGSAACTQTIVVAGRAGQSGADLAAEIRRHLKERGWGHGCRRTGWLLDHTTECVEVTITGDRVAIALSGHRDDVAHVVTLD